MIEFKKQPIILQEEDEHTKSLFRKEIWDAADYLNTSVRDVFEKNGVEFSLTNVSEWSTSAEKCRKYFEKAQTSFFGSAFIPPTEKRRIELEYARICREIVKALEPISDLKRKYPLIRLERQGGGEIHFRCIELNAVCDEIGLREFSDVNKEYYDLLQGVAEKMFEVARYEAEHELPEYILKLRPIYDLMGHVMMIESFVDDIIDGEINQRVLRRLGVIPTIKGFGTVNMERCKAVIAETKKID